MIAECHCPSFPHFLRAACWVSVMGRRLVRWLVRWLFAVIAVARERLCGLPGCGVEGPEHAAPGRRLLSQSRRVWMGT